MLGAEKQLPTNSVGAKAFAVLQDNTALYYGDFRTLNGPIRAWDLINETALPDLSAGFADEYQVGIGDGFTTAAGLIGFAFYKPSDGSGRIILFQSTGTIDSSFSVLTGASAPAQLNHYAITGDGLSVWVWTYDTAQASTILTRYLLSNGSITAGPFTVPQMNISGEVNQDDEPFAVSDSCPLFVLTQPLPPPEPLALACPADTTATVGVPYASSLVTTGGTGPFTYLLIAGALPPGLTLNPDTGEISGTPTALGFFSYTAQVTDSADETAQTTCSITVSATPPGPSGPTQTLLLDIKAKRWFADQYPSPVTVRLWEPGEGVHDQELGHLDGTVDLFSGHQDQGQPIPYVFQPPSINAGDIRVEKVYGDAFLEVDPKVPNEGFTLTVGINDFAQTLTPQTLGLGVTGRSPIIVDVAGGLGVRGKNVGILVEGSTSTDPIFFDWEIAQIGKVELIQERATDWESCGLVGAKRMQGFVIELQTVGTPKQIQVEYDGGGLSEVITLDSTLQGEIPYSFLDPFIAHLVRIVSVDAVEWMFYGVRWIFQPLPEAVSVYQTPPTTKDFPGFSQDERALIAHMSTVDFDFLVTADGQTTTYPIRHSNGLYTKTPVLFRPNKGLWYQYAFRVTDHSSTLRLFLQDCEVRSRSWGSGSGYQVLRPFGEQSRGESGARI